MTRKDFEAIARALRSSRPNPTDESAAGLVRLRQWNDTFYAMVSEIEKTNGNFNYDRFAKACGRGEQ
ncbi:MAG: hypothetical protein ACNA8H_06140 [Anaerolineales bacterium]